MGWIDNLDPERRGQLERAAQFLQTLRPPEQSIVVLAVQGYDDQIIATQRIISVRTVRRHIENIQNKTIGIYGRKLKFRQQLVPMLAPYLFLFSE